MFTRILLPTDFSSSAQAALELARGHFPQATRRLLHVLDPQRIAASLTSSVSAREDREALEGELRARLSELAWPGEELALEIGTAADVILSQAESWGADLIVMGTHGRTGLAHFLNGSVAEKVVRFARRPVLIEHEKRDG